MSNPLNMCHSFCALSLEQPFCPPCLMSDYSSSAAFLLGVEGVGAPPELLCYNSLPFACHHQLVKCYCCLLLRPTEINGRQINRVCYFSD